MLGKLLQGGPLLAINGVIITSNPYKWPKINGFHWGSFHPEILWSYSSTYRVEITPDTLYKAIYRLVGG